MFYALPGVVPELIVVNYDFLVDENSYESQNKIVYIGKDHYSPLKINKIFI